ncbi:MAG: trypsin-like peptidase domain-containing protein [Phycisphaeraceae bacterium]
MRNLCLSLVLTMSLAGCASTNSDAPADPRVAQLRQDMRSMIGTARDRVYPALVNINVVSVRYYAGSETKGRSVGSGTIISPKGYVLTNYHVTADGKKFTCTLSDRRQVSATLVGEDPLTDLAVLQLDLAELGDDQRVPYAELGDSAQVQVGDYVMAMGSPLSLSRSVTLGIVSNTQRVFAGGLDGGDVQEMELEPGQSTGMFTRWVQHDALINPGNSGGPLVNLAGQVVGVNELGGAGIGYAIPSNLAREVAAALIDHGEVPRSWIGVAFKPIERTGLQEGVLINSVVEHSPAAQAGIEPGDVLLELGVEPVTARFPEQLPPLLERIAEEPVGSRVPLLYRREGQVQRTTVVTEKYRPDRGVRNSFRAWGVSAMGLTQTMALRMRLKDATGVMITSTRRGSPADLAEPSLQGGDIIHRINDLPVEDMAGFIEMYRKLMDADPVPERVLIAYDRGGENQLTIIKPKKDDDLDPPVELPKAWLGVATQPVLRDLAKELQMPEATPGGYRVTRVYPGTRAADSDLKVGDIILGVDGDRLMPRGMQDTGMLNLRIRRMDIGQTGKFAVWRTGQTLEIPAVLERTRTTPAEARKDTNKDFELSVREVTFFDRDARRWDGSIKGVLVTEADAAGWAGLGGIRAGDLIQKIARQSVTDLDSYRAAMEQVEKDQPERVVFVVLRGVRTGFQYVEPDWKPVAADEMTKEE